MCGANKADLYANQSTPNPGLGVFWGDCIHQSYSAVQFQAQLSLYHLPLVERILSRFGAGDTAWHGGACESANPASLPPAFIFCSEMPVPAQLFGSLAMSTYSTSLFP